MGSFPWSSSVENQTHRGYSSIEKSVILMTRFESEI